MDTLKRIDELRLEKGWSVNNLAMEAMITQSTLNNIYLRKTEPKLSTLRALCNAFGITLAEFFSEEKDEKSDYEDELIKHVKSLNHSQQKTLLAFIKTIK
mgnify:FL=1